MMASWITALFLKMFSKSLTADFFKNFVIQNYYVYGIFDDASYFFDDTKEWCLNFS